MININDFVDMVSFGIQAGVLVVLVIYGLVGMLLIVSSFKS